MGGVFPASAESLLLVDFTAQQHCDADHTLGSVKQTENKSCMTFWCECELLVPFR